MCAGCLSVVVLLQAMSKQDKGNEATQRKQQSPKVVTPEEKQRRAQVSICVTVVQEQRGDMWWGKNRYKARADASIILLSIGN